MSGVKITLLLAAAAMALRAGLYFAGVAVAPFGFALAHLFFLVLATWASCHFLLRRDPSRGFGELLRAAFQSALIYALLLGLFTWLLYGAVDTGAFAAYNERLVQGLAAQGHPEALAREKVNGLYNARNYAVLSFFGLLMAGSLAATAFALLHHKVLRRFR